MTTNLEDDGFTLVKSKKNISNSSSKKYQIGISKGLANLNLNQNDKIDSVYVQDLADKIELIRKNLKAHDDDFYTSKTMLRLRKIVQDYFDQLSQNNLSNRINIYCYGIGSFDENLSSRYQLGLLLLIIQDLNDLNIANVELVEIYDPIFNKADKLLLQNLNLKIADENEKCIKQIKFNKTENSLNLFFMPHCPKALYNNLLYANWSIEHLKRIVLFGNSFNTIHNLTIDKNLSQYYSFIKDSLLILNEIKLDSKCELTNAFYDLNIHLFGKKEASLNSYDFINKLELNITDFNHLKYPIYEPNEEIF